MLLRNTSIALASILLGGAASLEPSNGDAAGRAALELRFRGSIDQTDLTGLTRILSKHRIARIYLDSGGGDEAASLKIAKLVAANRIDTVVDGRCLSACFNIFIAGSRKTIADGSIVATHHNAYGLHAWVQQAGFHPDAAARIGKSDFPDRVDTLYNLYTEALPGHAVRDYLAASFYQMDPLCLSLKSDGPAHRQRIFVKTRRSWIVPGRTVLVRLGVQPPSHWPGTQADLPGYLARSGARLSDAANAVLLEDFGHPPSHRPAPIEICKEEMP